MTLAALPVDQVLNIPFLSYHKPFELAKRLTRSGEAKDQSEAITLLEGLRALYPHILAIGQELMLALMEDKKHDRAEGVLMDLEAQFMSFDEETLCRWGRLFKDRGDEYIRLPWSNPEGRAAVPDLADVFYRKSLEKYDQAYRDRSGHYPGINKATLLLILGSLRPPTSGAPPRPELREAEELAGRLLADRPLWPRESPDDLTVWHPATAGEAHLLRREWSEAADQYREALKGRNNTPHSREAMRRQVERILMCFRNLGVPIPPPFDEPVAFFASVPVPPSGGPGPANSAPSEPSPGPST